MLLKATYDGHDCYINSDYIVDVFDIDKPEVKVYTIDLERGTYKMTKAEFERWERSEQNE